MDKYGYDWDNSVTTEATAQRAQRLAAMTQNKDDPNDTGMLTKNEIPVETRAFDVALAEDKPTATHAQPTKQS